MACCRPIYVILSVLVFVKQSKALDPNRKQSVTTVLNAKWPSTPFALEISEYLNDVKIDYFWAFLDYLAEDEMVHRKPTDKEFYNKLIEFSSRYALVYF